MLGRGEDLTSGRLLARNVVLNLFGWVLPAAAALVSIPVLVRGMGGDRFGLLTLAWTIVGYFSLFDLGIGRALTQALAERAGVGRQDESPQLTWTALWLLAPFGALCGAALAIGAPWLTAHALMTSPALTTETTTAVRLLGLSVPFMVVTSGFRAVLEAGQRFRLINLLRVPLGVLTFAGPAALQRVTHALPAAVLVLVVVRVLLCVLHVVAVWRVVPELRHVRGPRRADVVGLWRVAGWMTVTSIVSPVLVSADRFVIGAALAASALGYYATASEVATKMWLFTAALGPVLFPALAATIGRDDVHAAALFDRAMRVTALAVAGPALVLVLFAREGLALWLGDAFARASAPSLQFLAIAVYANCLAQVAFAAVQGGGRADIAGKLHLLELPLYLGALWALLHAFGLVGVALAWLLRMALDGLALLAGARAVLPAGSAALRRGTVLLGGGVVVLALLTIPTGLGLRVALGGVAVALLAVGGWRYLVMPDERVALVDAAGERWRAFRSRNRDVPSPA
ncbi:MAG TPA: flippase [Gemmatirosa sp.]